MSIVDRINESGLVVREFINPEWPFTTAVLSGKLLFVAGHTPTIDGVPQYHGKVGNEISVEQAREAGVLCLENCLGSMQRVLGDLNRIKKIVKLNGFVASTPEFSNQVAVMAPVSEALNHIFGEKHARAAIGVAVLPGDVPVEIELIVEIA